MKLRAYTECKDLEQSLETTSPNYMAYLAVLIALHDLSIFTRIPCVDVGELGKRVLMPRESLHKALETLIRCHIIQVDNKCLSLTNKGVLIIEKSRWCRTYS